MFACEGTISAPFSVHIWPKLSENRTVSVLDSVAVVAFIAWLIVGMGGNSFLCIVAMSTAIRLEAQCVLPGYHQF